MANALAHLLMKNTVLETLGFPGYGLLIEAALVAMDPEGREEGMIEHIEDYEHYGYVRVFIHDLRQAWESERERRRNPMSSPISWRFLLSPCRLRSTKLHNFKS